MLAALWPMRMMERVMKDAGFQPTGFKSAILQAEFQVSEKQVFDLYGTDKTPTRTSRTEQMRRAHWYDNLFLCFYGLFLAIFAVQGFRLTHLWHFMLMILLAVAAACADFIENGAIVAITHALDAGETSFSLLIKRLAFFTWLKWLSLGLYFGVLTRFFWQSAQWGHLPAWLGKLLGAVSLITCFVAFSAFLTRDAEWENRMAQAITVLFTVLFLFSLLYRRRDNR